MSDNRAYHHGDLRRTVLEAAVEMIVEKRHAQLSLRELARRAGVSHAAPAHHFKDKAGLMTAIAVEGNELLADTLAEAFDDDAPDLKELGVRYIQFAADHPGHFAVMYRPDLCHRDDPELAAARSRAAELLRAGVESIPGERRGPDGKEAALAAWVLAHGFADLWLSGSLRAMAPEGDPTVLFRNLAAHLFAGPPDSPSGTDGEPAPGREPEPAGGIRNASD